MAKLHGRGRAGISPLRRDPRAEKAGMATEAKEQPDEPVTSRGSGGGERPENSPGMGETARKFRGISSSSCLQLRLRRLERDGSRVKNKRKRRRPPPIEKIIKKLLKKSTHYSFWIFLFIYSIIHYFSGGVYLFKC